MKGEDMEIICFDDVKAIFESHNICFGGHEIYWYQRAWECGEFCELALDEPYSYEFFRDDVEVAKILSDYAVGQLIMKLQYEFNKLPHHSCEVEFYNNYEVDSAFFNLISEERYRVFNAIKKNINILYDTELILTSMYITTFIPFKNVEDEILEEINSYEDYLSVCDRFVDVISELFDEYHKAYRWLLEGTYKI